MKKLSLLTLLVTSLFLTGCASAPDAVMDDGREAAERAKAKSREAYKDLDDSL